MEFDLMMLDCEIRLVPKCGLETLDLQNIQVTCDWFNNFWAATNLLFPWFNKEGIHHLSRLHSLKLWHFSFEEGIPGNINESEEESTTGLNLAQTKAYYARSKVHHRFQTEVRIPFFLRAQKNDEKRGILKTIWGHMMDF